jgi:hypothetical protein
VASNQESANPEIRPRADLEIGYFIRLYGNVALKPDGKSISGAHSAAGNEGLISVAFLDVVDWM